MSFERLINEHDAIERIAQKFEHVIKASGPNHSTAVELLTEPAGAIDEHLRYEDRRVYASLLSLKAAGNQPAQVDFEAMFLSLRADWEGYLRGARVSGKPQFQSHHPHC